MRRAAAAACVVTALVAAACRDRPAIPAAPTFTGSKVCAECHSDRHATWMRTGHAYALLESSDATVVAAFDGKPVEHPKFTATPYRGDDGSFRIRVVRRDGSPPEDWRADRAIGRGMQQAFLATSPKGDWELLHLTWNLREARWQLTGEVLGEISADPGRYDDFHPESHGFNHGCAGCHATGFDAGWDEITGRYETRMVEGSISCESCHGPGSAHAARFRRPLVPGDAYAPPERLLQPREDLDPAGVSALCGRCHENHWFRYALDDDPRAGPRDVAVSRHADDFGFYADGRFSGLQYDHTVTVESACSVRGRMSCLSCHDMHGGRPRAMRFDAPDDDAQCTQCHEETGAAGRGHTHHENLRCVDCHMPRLAGGLLAEQRDHSIRSPEPAFTERFGAANHLDACTKCHEKEGAAWARERREAWYGPADETEAARIAVVVALRGQPDGVSTDALVRLAEDRGARRFHRLTALRALAARPGPEVPATLLRLLDDPQPDVRLAAAERVGERGRPAEAAPALVRMLAAKERTLRVEAAWALAKLGRRGEDAAVRAAWTDAQGMIPRRRVFDDAWERIWFIADSLGETAHADRALASMRRLPSWKDGPPHATAREILHRHARRLLESGDLDGAARELAAAGADAATDGLLAVDAIELAERRGERSAPSRWLDLAARSTDPAVQATAAYRAALATGRAAAEKSALERIAAALERDPVGGEALRRVRAALR